MHTRTHTHTYTYTHIYTHTPPYTQALSLKADPHGSIGEWDISRIRDMTRMFADVRAFNGVHALAPLA